MDKDILNILKKIDAKIGALIALQMVEDMPETNRNKIKLLSNLGLTNKEIASILNSSEKYIAKEKSLIKKKNG